MVNRLSVPGQEVSKGAGHQGTGVYVRTRGARSQRDRYYSLVVKDVTTTLL